MARHKQHHAIEGDGWSEWVQPVMSGYKLTCCDCGLVHEMEFEALRKGADNPDGSWRATELDRQRYRVQFRVRRHPLSTAAIRRHMKAR